MMLETTVPCCHPLYNQVTAWSGGMIGSILFTICHPNGVTDFVLFPAHIIAMDEELAICCIA